MTNAKDETNEALSTPSVANPIDPPPAHESSDQVEEPRRVFAPDPFARASDYAVGLHLAESRRARRSLFSFDERPTQAVIDKLKENDFRWNSRDRNWVKPIHQDTALQDRIDADRLYRELSIMMREEKGIEADRGQTPF